MPEPTFSARPADDGTDTVEIQVDSQTALQLAAAWDHTHQSVPVNAILRPTYLLDSAALRRAAASARNAADAAAQVIPFSPRALRVAGGETS